LLKGDIVRLETSGGGGFGDPAKRPSARRNADQALGYVKG
jgi:N-methylhydantoinase B